MWVVRQRAERAQAGRRAVREGETEGQKGTEAGRHKRGGRVGVDLGRARVNERLGLDLLENASEGDLALLGGHSR
eukprot:2978051-Prymnesium_polylepis.1